MRTYFRYLSMAGGMAALVMAASLACADDGEKKDGSLRVKDLPKPIPEAMNKIQQVGNEVGKGISKAAGEGAEAVKKALKGNKAKEK
ncbi:MAG TPA: hypothetical protein VJ692_04660 [Nitrospiraceae bacterium]|nr:hypothetical protein [Nitrospiraceae bacterium]